MYEGNPVDLQMEKVISADGIFDDTTRACRVYKYDIEDEYIYLELKGINLLKFRIENGFYNIYEDRRATRHI